MSDPRKDPDALVKAWERAMEGSDTTFEEFPYRPPSKRRLQVEAWGIFLTFLVVSWCLVGGVVLGVKVLLTLANALFH
jgi:hypothetical protein